MVGPDDYVHHLLSEKHHFDQLQQVHSDSSRQSTISSENGSIHSFPMSDSTNSEIDQNELFIGQNVNRMHNMRSLSESTFPGHFQSMLPIQNHFSHMIQNSTNQSINGQISNIQNHYPSNQFDDKSMHQYADYASFNQPVNQSFNQSVQNQSFNQSVSHPQYGQMDQANQYSQIDQTVKNMIMGQHPQSNQSISYDYDVPVPAVPIHAVSAITLQSIDQSKPHSTFQPKDLMNQGYDQSINHSDHSDHDHDEDMDHDVDHDHIAMNVPLIPVITLDEVFHKKGPIDAMFRRMESFPVRPINHLQTMVWHAFNSGKSLRDIHQTYSITPSTALNHLIYCFESFSPSIKHPIFIHWHRFSIPDEVKEKIFTSLGRPGAVFHRIDLVQADLRASNINVLDDDVRVTMVRYKMEGAIKRQFVQFKLFRSMDDETGDQALESLTEVRAAYSRSDESISQSSNESINQSTTESVNPSSKPSAVADDDVKKTAFSMTDIEKSVSEMTHPGKFVDSNPTPSTVPMPLTNMTVLHFLCINGAMPVNCLKHNFPVDTEQLEPVLDKLVEEKLIWKRGKVYSPT